MEILLLIVGIIVSFTMGWAWGNYMQYLVFNGKYKWAAFHFVCFVVFLFTASISF